MNRKLKLLLMGTVAGTLAFTDNTIKNKIENGRINNGVIDKRGFAKIERHHNKGLPLNALDAHTKEITAVSSAILTGLMIDVGSKALNSDSMIEEVSNTLMLGGALSNTYDRIARGYVVDYLLIGRKKAIYNISDFMIIGGAVLRLVDAFRSSN